MITYDSAKSYVLSATTVQGKITHIDTVITALEGVMVDAAESGNISEYMLNDGQTKIEAKYTGVQDVVNSMMALNKLRTFYVNQLAGRVVTLVDQHNFR